MSFVAYIAITVLGLIVKKRLGSIKGAAVETALFSMVLLFDLEFPIARGSPKMHENVTYKQSKSVTVN